MVDTSLAEPRSSRIAILKTTPISDRLLPLLVLAFLLALPVVRFAQDGGPVLSAIAMLVGVVGVAVLPGLLVSLLAGALRSDSLLDAVVVGFGASFAIVQVLTVIALTRHVSSSIVVLGLWACCCVLALLFLVRPPRNRWATAAGRWQWLIVGLALVLGASLYVQSPIEPWMSGEDAIHLAVIQRLAYEPRPALDNIYYAPDFIYTYPFPAIHYFIALISRATSLEPIFVYQKLRMLWGPMALLLLFTAARVIFASERAAIASALTAAVLTVAGAFGPISSTWGQLAPMSHASDIAMTVLLPALVVFALKFAGAETRRTAALFLFGTLTLVLTLTIVHIREVVQFLVYVSAAWAVYALMKTNRRLAFRFGFMAIVAVAIVVSYLKWYQTAVGHVDQVVAQRRAILIQAAAAMSPRELLTPIFENGYFVVNQQYFFYTWLPVVLLLAPLVLIAYRSRPLVPFVAASLLAYAIIVFVPIVSIVYVYLTYYEILFTPVRNSLFFIYLLAGPLLLLAGDAIGAIARPRIQMALGVATVAMLWIAYAFFGRVFLQPQSMMVKNVFFLTIIGGYTVALVNWRRLASLHARLGVLAAGAQEPWRLQTTLPFVGLLAGVLLIGFSWKTSPLHFDVKSSKWTFRQYLASMNDIKAGASPAFRDPLSGKELRLSDREVVMAAPSPELVDFGRRALPASSVFVHNLFNLYASPAFMPQHILMWPVDSPAGMEFNARLFQKPWAALMRTADAHHAQPFFNDEETLEERVSYMNEVGATHVLLDPMYYARLRGYLSQWPTIFSPIYDDGRRWAVFEFRK